MFRLVRRIVLFSIPVLLGAALAYATEERPRREPTAIRVSRPPAPSAATPNDEREPASIEHTTWFEYTRRHRARAHNIELGASRLNGAVIPPNGTFSFNARVGPRTRERGFVPTEVRRGEPDFGVGGGVCQLATTLYVAALQSGLDIVEHRPHSAPPEYAEPGLDATVVDGRTDFRLRNPHAFPVRVRARVDSGMLQVAIGAHEAIRPCEIRRVVQRTQAPEVTILDASLPAGARIVASGRRGQTVRVRAVCGEDARSERTVEYAPEPRIVRVGPSPAERP